MVAERVGAEELQNKLAGLSILAASPEAVAGSDDEPTSVTSGAASRSTAVVRRKSKAHAGQAATEGDQQEQWMIKRTVVMLNG